MLRSQAARARPGGRRRHRAPRHHARRHLPRLRHPHRRPCSPVSSSSAPRSSAPRSGAPRSLAGTSLVGSSLVGTSLVAAAPRSVVPRSAVPRPESPWAPVQATAAYGQASCVPHGRAGQATIGRTHNSGRTHGTPGPGILCRGSRGYVMCYSCCIFTIPVAIPSPNVRNSRNSSSYSSYSQHVRVQE